MGLTRPVFPRRSADAVADRILDARYHRINGEQLVNCRKSVLAALAGLLLYEVMLSFKQGSLLGDSYLFSFTIMLGRLEVFYRRYALSFAPPPTTAVPIRA